MKPSQKDLQQLLLSRQLMFITAEGYASAVAEAFSDECKDADKSILYHDLSKNMCEQMSLQVSEDNPVNFTTEYTSEEIPEGTLAYYPVFGIITSDSSWRFSSKRFEKNFWTLKAILIFQHTFFIFLRLVEKRSISIAYHRP